MSCITCGTWTDMDLGEGRAGTMRVRRPRGVPCLVTKRRVQFPTRWG